MAVFALSTARIAGLESRSHSGKKYVQNFSQNDRSNVLNLNNCSLILLPPAMTRGC